MAQLSPGSLLEKRYRIVTLLGQGGFGRAYLAEDLNRFNERCVLKEFNPQVQGTEAWQKAKQLFQREAAVLHRLHHPQIPQFWELLQVDLYGEELLFLVQEYIEGQTYWQILQHQGCLSEADAVHLLEEILPVLAYLHAQGVIHRDIAPDNLIQKYATGKPVLIDFGGVKQIAATLQPHGQQPASTQLWKEGYTPIEQRHGNPLPCSDLYALAVTILVLLTNRAPAELYDGYQAAWRWQSILHLHPLFAAVLEKMLAARAMDRYASAAEVLQALQPLTNPALSPPLSQVRTWAVAGVARTDPPVPAIAPPATGGKTLVVAPQRPQFQPPTQTHTPSTKGNWLLAIFWFGANLVWFVLKLGFAILKWVAQSLAYLLQLLFTALITSLFQSVFGMIWTVVILGAIVAIGFAVFFKGGLAWLPKLPQLPDWSKSIPTSQRTCEQVIQRREDLKMPKQSFYSQVDQRFYAQHPELQQRTLDPNSQQDAPLQQEWCQIADQVINDWEKTQR